MPVTDENKDEVRGIGFVTLHSAYLEAQIHDLLQILDSVEPYGEEQQTWPIDRKIKASRQRLNKLDSKEFEGLRDTLNNCKKHFVWRNEIIHSKIYSPEYIKDNLVSTRPGVPPRKIDVEEIYTLANNLTVLQSEIRRAMMFRIPQALVKYVPESV